MNEFNTPWWYYENECGEHYVGTDDSEGTGIAVCELVTDEPEIIGDRIANCVTALSPVPPGREQEFMDVVIEYFTEDVECGDYIMDCESCNIKKIKSILEGKR